MKIYDAKTKKYMLASVPIHIAHPHDGEDIETLIDIELRRTRFILKRNYQEQFNDARQTEKLLNEMTFAEASLAFLDSAKSPSVSL